MSPLPAEAVETIRAAGRRLDQRGWVPATAGNISLRLADGRIAITRSGFHKGFIPEDGAMAVDLHGRPEASNLRPSAETGLHCGIYRRFPAARAALHGHSVPATVLSRRGGDHLELSGYELLKAFPGLPTHEASIRLPILDNDQDIARLQARVEQVWDAAPDVPPGYILRGHGVYVWGEDMPGALMRLEALEFMLACELEAARLP
ncbi:methylthioribulose 1-phosphate dehydratase [Roseococcus suduntuyensis]|uniref:Methylthioribulose-1-phosphate dehydratase n=1 Tax=Roseococcus suduntuyensis TaxID=455361 RepID=A0A840A7L8_9PROT|nr:methylthioribulose 1-phosphate dehydratase [Roseococcus suduntuyensis]MBB3897211.1 methylthioribulose-1-phosphate dehydratase [Roseococcus suduntuyensis]